MHWGHAYDLKEFTNSGYLYAAYYDTQVKRFVSLCPPGQLHTVRNLLTKRYPEIDTMLFEFKKPGRLEQSQGKLARTFLREIFVREGTFLTLAEALAEVGLEHVEIDQGRIHCGKDENGLIKISGPENSVWAWLHSFHCTVRSRERKDEHSGVPASA